MKENSHQKMTLEEVRKIFSEDKTEIISKYKAEGAGIGMSNDIVVIRVYVQDIINSDEQPQWKQIPIEFVKTTKIKSH